MSVSFRVEKSGSAEVVRKKSRFLSVLLSVSDEKEAFFEIEKIKKEHYNARHNCFAFITGKEPFTERFSDDGEPQGTAGKVILDVMKHNHLSNALIVVTRYFGGVLLGTGGLTEAYSSAAAEAVKSASLMQVLMGKQVTISLDYTDYGKIEYLIRDKGIPVLSSDFSESVKVSVMTMAERDEEKSTDDGRGVCEQGHGAYEREGGNGGFRSGRVRARGWQEDNPGLVTRLEAKPRAGY